jgi:hypothetical protein
MPGAGEVRRIHAPESRTQIWVVPTNEELIVACQARELLESWAKTREPEGKPDMFVAKVTGSLVSTQKVARWSAGNC